jgi:translation initiation factor IF-2
MANQNDGGGPFESGDRTILKPRPGAGRPAAPQPPPYGAPQPPPAAPPAYGSPQPPPAAPATMVQAATPAYAVGSMRDSTATGRSTAAASRRRCATANRSLCRRHGPAVPGRGSLVIAGGQPASHDRGSRRQRPAPTVGDRSARVRGARQGIQCAAGPDWCRALRSLCDSRRSDIDDALGRQQRLGLAIAARHVPP